MKGFRGIFWLLPVVSLLNTIFMININQNGLKALNQLPLQLFILLIGVISFFVMMVKGITRLGGSSDFRKEEGWTQADTLKFYIAIGFLLYNIAIMWFLAR